MSASVRDREAHAAAVLVALHGPDGPDEWQPADFDAAEAAALVLAEWVRRDGRNGEPVEPKPKPPRRSTWKPDPPELTASKKVVRKRSGGICEAQTPWCEHFATQVHHIAGRVGKGCHAPEMLLDVCGNGNLSGCHGYIEQHIDDATAYERGWLRSRLGQVRP